MRIDRGRFSVPDCIWEEPMPGKAFKLLTFLIAKSDVGGAVRPGYEAMKRAIRERDGERGSNTTVRTCLARLKKSGWIFTMRRSNSKMTIWLQIPPRFRKEKPLKNVVSVVQS